MLDPEFLVEVVQFDSQFREISSNFGNISTAETFSKCPGLKKSKPKSLGHAYIDDRLGMVDQLGKGGIGLFIQSKGKPQPVLPGEFNPRLIDGLKGWIGRTQTVCEMKFPDEFRLAGANFSKVFSPYCPDGVEEQILGNLTEVVPWFRLPRVRRLGYGVGKQVNRAGHPANSGLKEMLVPPVEYRHSESVGLWDK